MPVRGWNEKRRIKKIRSTSPMNTDKRAGRQFFLNTTRSHGHVVVVVVAYSFVLPPFSPAFFRTHLAHEILFYMSVLGGDFHKIITRSCGRAKKFAYRGHSKRTQTVPRESGERGGREREKGTEIKRFSPFRSNRVFVSSLHRTNGDTRSCLLFSSLLILSLSLSRGIYRFLFSLPSAHLYSSRYGTTQHDEVIFDFRRKNRNG